MELLLHLVQLTTLHSYRRSQYRRSSNRMFLWLNQTTVRDGLQRFLNYFLCLVTYTVKANHSTKTVSQTLKNVQSSSTDRIATGYSQSNSFLTSSNQLREIREAVQIRRHKLLQICRGCSKSSLEGNELSNHAALIRSIRSTSRLGETKSHSPSNHVEAWQTFLAQYEDFERKWVQVKDHATSVEFMVSMR